MQAKSDIRELDSRTTSYGLSVALLWDAVSGETFIEMETDEDWARFPVRPEDAASAFQHPFVYRARSEQNFAPIAV